jgi:hypothetical protein
VRFTSVHDCGSSASAIALAIRIRDLHVADTVRVSLDWFMCDTFGSQVLQERAESGNGEGDPARARPRCVRLNEERGVLVDVPEDLFAAQARRSPEEPCVPIDRGAQLGHGDTSDEVVIAPYMQLLGAPPRRAR